MITNFKVKPWRSAKYRRFVASLPCCICGAASNAHHEAEEAQGTMGGKCGDERCIPLCPRHHADRHLLGRLFWSVHHAYPGFTITITQAAWERLHKSRPWESK